MVHIVTGGIHQGKTTRILFELKSLPQIAGFTMPAVFRGNTRWGYDLRLYPGEEHIPFLRLSSDPEELPPGKNITLGKYLLSTTAVERGSKHIRELLAQGCPKIVMDELGFLESQGRGFTPEVREVLQKKVDLWTGVRNTSLEDFLVAFQITDYRLIQIEEEPST